MDRLKDAKMLTNIEDPKALIGINKMNVALKKILKPFPENDVVVMIRRSFFEIHCMAHFDY